MRRLVTLLAIVLTAAPAAREAAAQAVSGVLRGGLLIPGSPGRMPAGHEFREGMRSLGWIEGKTISIEDRFANGDPARLSASATEFAAAEVDVIVAIATLATLSP